ncbi:uncharacterized protein LOC134844526 [Symsagittifera roscoffensis]|uniref:uncharacterized protein LOC134844526 n=1 Tax=Symsagittifera roscoffensis TaxID=84072 RepID=UPI00307B6C5B
MGSSSRRYGSLKEAGLYLVGVIVLCLSALFAAMAHFSHDADGGDRFHQGLWYTCRHGICFQYGNGKINTARAFLIMDHLLCACLLATLVYSFSKRHTIYCRLLLFLSVLHSLFLFIACCCVTSQVHDDVHAHSSWGMKLPWVGWVLSLALLLDTLYITISTIREEQQRGAGGSGWDDVRVRASQLTSVSATDLIGAENI